MSKENIQSTQLGQRIADMLRDVPCQSARTAITIASALIEEKNLNEISGQSSESRR